MLAEQENLEAMRPPLDGQAGDASTSGSSPVPPSARRSRYLMERRLDAARSSEDEALPTLDAWAADAGRRSPG